MDDLFNAYREEMGRLRLSDAEKDALTRRIDAKLEQEESAVGASTGIPGAPKAETRPRTHTHRRGSLGLKLAACLGVIAVLLASSAAIYARGTFSAARGYIEDVFGSALAQTEVVGAVGRPVGAASTDGELKITCEAILGDARNIAIIYSLESTDGGSLEDVAPVGSNGHYDLAFSGPSGVTVDGIAGSGGAAYFYDAVPGDGKIQYVQMQGLDLAGDEGLIGRTARVTLVDLRRIDADDSSVAYSGTWSFKFKINYRDLSKRLVAGAEAEWGEKTIGLEDVTLSPVAITVAYSADGDPTQLRELPIEVEYADGEVFTSESFTVTASERDGKATLVKTVFLDRIASTGDVAGARIGETYFSASEL